ncbi:MAG: GNAT family N-acetyltransferase [Kibdelosporangium sp.]
MRFADLSADEFRARLDEALSVYAAAMVYSAGVVEQRIPIWRGQTRRDGWRCVVALDHSGRLAGFGYGYRGAPGQWWDDRVRAPLAGKAGQDTVDRWMRDYFAFTELHVRPDSQGNGVGERMLRRLLSGAPHETVLLSTPEGPGRAWNLYRRIGFVDLLRDHSFGSTDPRPYAVLGIPQHMVVP